MGMLNLYDWILPDSQAELLSKYKDNEPLYNMARSFWNSLDSASMFFFIIAFVVAVIVAYIYYYPYNRKAGRRYKVSKWAWGLAITAIITFVATIISGYILVSSTLKERFDFIIWISFINGVYAIVSYLVVSFFICKYIYKLYPTNAYRFLDI